MTEFWEAMKGFTDLPIAVFSLVLGLLLIKAKNRWNILFLLISVAAFLGALVHIFDFGANLKNIIWVILYPMLFESVRRFTLLFYEYVSKEKGKDTYPIFIFEAAFLLAAILLMFMLGKYDMLLFIAFSAVCLIRIIAVIIKTKKFPVLALIMTVGIIPPLLLQCLSGMLPFAVTLEHIFLAAELFVAYKMASSI